MKVTAIRTHKISPKEDLFKVLDVHLNDFKEESILAVASKIVSVCEGSVIPVSEVDKDELIAQQADLHLSRTSSKYNIMLTVKDNILIPSAGIDESNGNEHYILWPKNPQETANKIREYLCERFQIKHAGVIIVDSKTTPLRWGTTGIALAHSGFLALKDYIGQKDIYDREILMTKANMMDGLAASAVLTMGEGGEQTPLAVIDHLPFIIFQDRNPTQKELNDLAIEIEDDIYAPILNAVDWKKRKA